MQITLKAARINKGLTQEQVAAFVGVTKQTVGSWENGKTIPPIEKIELLCPLYEVSYNDIRWRNKFF